ncbi:PREDICTED: carnitine O-palmitoyltransferase 2, mitochondrial [Nicrophorus vespilloides]|uniref:Carnitine O-palmitoyltransferase 2, mitochondrial n=1 Tax=Nicrophorus vespilloides TaxID=110193 RepID=A0ABM1M3B1_NICVS|nr:PREDICTED: carnitine O-palmitoyltransferase 2, mitochondrial [Nicrophorus vespilloides]
MLLNQVKTISKKSITQQLIRHKHDYQYLQNSKIPTMHFQKSLPRLPIPKLEETCARYLAAQKPILPDKVFDNTQATVKKFQETVGKHLQEQLINWDKTNKHTSYITEYWFDMYLKDRKPIPINYNPVLVFQNDSRPEYNDQAVRTTNLLISSLRFYKSLKKQILDPEVFHMNPKKSDTPAFKNICSMVPSAVSWYAAYMFNAYPLDMSQYNKLFNTTRIPQMDKDKIVSEPARHICVQYKGNFYTFDVLDESDNILPPGDIKAGIVNILNSDAKSAEFPLGILTTMDRNKWAKSRNNLVNLGNEQALKKIDSALFNICLDDDIIGDDKYALVRSSLHGDGKNRWFDKTISLLVTKDGFSSINFEHSWGDGVAVLRFFQDILKDSTEHPEVNKETKLGLTAVNKIEFNIDDSLKQDVSTAISEYSEVTKSLDVNFVESEGLGKVFCKKYSVSPDAIMQLCFQSAYHKQTGRFVASYESCSTAAFKHGRTETIRPNTSETKEFCLAINSANRPSNSELVDLIKRCSKVHGQLTKEAAMGQGFDRHLFALKMFSGKVDLSNANIFEDPAYGLINHNILSTSTLSSPAVLAGGFGPVVRDGLGIGYVIRDNAMGTLATSYPGVNGRDFISCLEKSIEEVVNVLGSAE